MARKITLDQCYKVAFPNGLRKNVGPGEVDESELPAEFVKNYRALHKQADAPGTPLEGSFPGRKALELEGYRTLEAVMAASDAELREVPGVGEATLRAIREATGQQPPEAPKAPDDGKPDGQPDDGKQDGQEEGDKGAPADPDAAKDAKDAKGAKSTQA